MTGSVVTRRSATAGLALLALTGLGWWWYRAYSAERGLSEARALVGDRRADAVLADLRRRHPDRPDVFLLSARQSRLAGQPGEAWAHLERATALGADSAAVARENLLGRPATDFPGTRPDLDRLLAADPGDADVLLALADGELAQGRAEVAAELADRAVRNAPGDVRATAVRGEARMRARRLDLARADLTAAVAAGPDALAYPRARLALATCLLDLGEFAPALELFRAARTENPGDLVAAFGVGRTASHLRRLEEADEAFGAVLAARPAHVDTLLARAHVAEQRGDRPRALEYLERAEQADPNRRETHSALARLLDALGHADRAAAHEARYRALEPAATPASGRVP